MKSIYQEVKLDRVTIYNQTVVDAHLMERISTEDRMQILADEDAYARRTILRAFGKSGRIEMRCPLTWFDHFKHALKERWPRLFRRLNVRWDVKYAETGAVVADLKPLNTRHMVVPYVLTDDSYPRA